MPYRWPNLLFSLDLHLSGLTGGDDLPHHVSWQAGSLGFFSELSLD